MKTITRRELSRNPSKLSSLKPGETMMISDKQGGMTLRREKKVTLDVAGMEKEIQQICASSPKLDSLSMMKDEA